jgi:hypothetical protein
MSTTSSALSRFAIRPAGLMGTAFLFMGGACVVCPRLILRTCFTQKALQLAPTEEESKSAEAASSSSVSTAAAAAESSPVVATPGAAVVGAQATLADKELMAFMTQCFGAQAMLAGESPRQSASVCTVCGCSRMVAARNLAVQTF